MVSYNVTMVTKNVDVKSVSIVRFKVSRIFFFFFALYVMLLCVCLECKY